MENKKLKRYELNMYS